MARLDQPRHLSQSQLRRLRQLPHRQGFVLEGGRRELPTAVDMPGAIPMPSVALWVDPNAGYIRNVTFMLPDGDPITHDEQAIVSLVHACLGPFTDARPMPPSAPGDVAAEVANTLLAAISQLTPELPELIRLNDPILLRSAREIFAPARVRVELVEEIESFERAFASLSEYLAQERLTLPMFESDVDETTSQRLLDASLALKRLDPWQVLPDLPPVEVALGELGPQDGATAVVVVLRGAEDELVGEGVDIYFSLADLEREDLLDSPSAAGDLEAVLSLLEQTGTAPTPGMTQRELTDAISELLKESAAQGKVVDSQPPPTFDAISLVYRTPEEVTDPVCQSYSEHGVKAPAETHLPQFVRVSREGEPRALNAREARAVAATFEAIAQFVEANLEDLQALDLEQPDEPLSHTARVHADGPDAAVQVTYPAPGYELDEDDDLPPATEEGKRTVYRFRVELVDHKDTWRRVELTGDQTLEDLHFAIQDAFQWDNDHLYAFFLSGKAWDEATEYGAGEAEGEQSAFQFRLESLPLAKRQHILYIFDFGDEWRHRITVEAIEPDAANPDTTYPAIIERHGDPVPQYPPLEGWE